MLLQRLRHNNNNSFELLAAGSSPISYFLLLLRVATLIMKIMKSFSPFGKKEEEKRKKSFCVRAMFIPFFFGKGIRHMSWKNRSAALSHSCSSEAPSIHFLKSGVVLSQSLPHLIGAHLQNKTNCRGLASPTTISLSISRLSGEMLQSALKERERGNGFRE